MDKPSYLPAARIETRPTLHALHKCPRPLKADLRKATERLRDLVERMGYAEAMWVAEELGFEYGIGWDGEKFIISMSGLQVIAYAAALRAHMRALWPDGGEREEATERGREGREVRKGKRQRS